jgi:hypothetical protein
MITRDADELNINISEVGVEVEYFEVEFNDLYDSIFDCDDLDVLPMMSVNSVI